MRLFHWLCTHDGKLLILSLGILAACFGLWQSILLNREATLRNREETLLNRTATERNFEALQRLERLIVERGK